MGETPFWKTKGLEEMTGAEWESLCDGCGLCCLNKLEDWDSSEIAWTSIRCTLLDGESCRCKDYDNRQATVPDCIQLTPKAVREISWLPPTCGYRLVAEGRISTGGTRSSPAIRRPCMRPAYPCADAPSPRTASISKIMKIIS